VEEAVLRSMLNDLQDLECKLEALEGELRGVRDFSYEKVVDFAFVFNYSLFLLREIEKLKLRKRLLEQAIEEQKKKLAYKRGEVRILENYVRKKLAEKERRNELFFERFINEVRLGSGVVF